MVLPFWCSQHARFRTSTRIKSLVIENLLCSLQCTEEEFANCMSKDKYLFFSRFFFPRCLSFQMFSLVCNNPDPSRPLRSCNLYQVFSSLKMVPCSSVLNACEKRLSVCQTAKRHRHSRGSVSDEGSVCLHHGST